MLIDYSKDCKSAGHEKGQCLGHQIFGHVKRQQQNGTKTAEYQLEVSHAGGSGHQASSNLTRLA